MDWVTMGWVRMETTKRKEERKEMIQFENIFVRSA